MIGIEKIEELISSKLSTGEFFIVSLDVSTANRIKLVVDRMKGSITIDEIVEFSRAIEHNLDRETEDFELEVTSPGLDMPLRVIQQYEKNIGRELDVMLTGNSKKIRGSLQQVKDDNIILVEEKKAKSAGSKKKEIVKTEHTINISEIKTAHIRIKF